MTNKRLLIAIAAGLFLLAACSSDDAPEPQNTSDEAVDRPATREAIFSQATLEQGMVLTATASSPTPSATSTDTPTSTPTDTPQPTDTPTDTPTSTASATFTASPTDTPDVQQTVDAAIAATLTAQPPTDTPEPTDTPLPTEVALQPVTYLLTFSESLDIGFARPDDWSEDTSGQEAIIESPDRTSGVILQRGGQGQLSRQGLLGSDADLSAALENISLIGQDASVSEVTNLSVDLFGVPALELRAEDVSTATLAYLLTFNEDDYLLVVGYSPVSEASLFEQQVMKPLLLSIDRMDTVAQPTEVDEDIAEEPTVIPSEVQPEPTDTPIPEPTEAPPTEQAQAAETEAPPTPDQGGGENQPVPPGEGEASYSSRALQLSFNYPEDATLEQDGPIIIINHATDENARVVLLRGTPDFLVNSQIVPTSDSPGEALTQLVEESLGETIEPIVEQRFGTTTYSIPLDFLPNVDAAYYIADFDTEWVFILTVAPLGGPEDFKATLVDPVLNSLVISPPVAAVEEPNIDFPVTYSSPTTGLMVGTFEDTQVIEGDIDTTFIFEEAEVTIWVGEPGLLVERGVIDSDIGLISALRGIANGLGVEDVTINPERVVRYERSAVMELEADGVPQVYVGAITNVGDTWIIVRAVSTGEGFQEFADTTFLGFLDSLDVVDVGSLDIDSGGAPDEPSGDAGEAEVQPTYTPLPTLTPLPTYTQPAS